MRSLHAFSMAGLLVAICISPGRATELPLPSPPFLLPVSADGIQRAIVTLDSYSYSPSHLVVEAGKPVELTLTSVTLITPHNLIIDDPAAGFSVEQEVGARKTVTIMFTPNQPGLFPIYCDKRLWPMPSHRDNGMEGKLEVKQ